jgi:bifunctional non-homologous end joining protein LigD
MAFDIMELSGEDLRQLPLWHRREVLQGVMLFGNEGLRLSVPIDAPGDAVFRAACQHGLEGIVSKRLDGG